jgi:hypothetical protein
MKYFVGIREAYSLFERAHDDASHTHWITKNPQEFLKFWHAKLAKKLDSCVHVVT